MSLTNPSQVNCPECGHQFPIEQAFIHDLEHRLKAEYDQKYQGKNQSLLKKEKDLANTEARLLKQQTEIELQIQQRIGQERKALTVQLSKEAEAVVKEKLASLNRQVQNQSQELSALKKQEVELMEAKAKLEREKKDIDLDVKRKLLEGRQKIEAEIREETEQANYLKLREKDQLVAKLTEQISDLKRRAEQGSTQSQGEIQEIELEKLLGDAFPADNIAEVPKGRNGADVLQRVQTPMGIECGLIAYESKRTKNFNSNWIAKLKEDMRLHKAEVGVIVTETMPEGMPRFGMIDGIWICGFHEVRGVATALRHGLIRLQQEKAFSVNKGDKMQQLYQYLTSRDFRHQMEAIVGGFKSMKEQLEREKRLMKKQWASREKELERIIDGATFMYGSIKGIAGNAVREIEDLEIQEAHLLDSSQS